MHISYLLYYAWLLLKSLIWHESVLFVWSITMDRWLSSMKKATSCSRFKHGHNNLSVTQVHVCCQYVKPVKLSSDIALTSSYQTCNLILQSQVLKKSETCLTKTHLSYWQRICEIFVVVMKSHQESLATYNVGHSWVDLSASWVLLMGRLQNLFNMYLAGEICITHWI